MASTQNSGPLEKQIEANRSATKRIDGAERFRALVDQAAVGMALESMDGEIFHVNPTFCRMLGYTEEELRKMRCTEFSHPEDEDAEMVLFNELRDGRRSAYQIDKRFRSKSGEWVWSRVSVSLLKTETDPPLVVGIAEDIRERRQAEEQLKTTKVELEQLAGRLLRAQEEERSRISRELHDDLGQRITLMGVEIERLQQELQADRKTILAERVTALKHELEGVGSAIHDFCRNLHSLKLDLLGLRAALKELSSNISQRSGMSVAVEVDEEANHLPAGVALCFYRVVQEALNNAAKHGKALAAEVTAKRVGEMIRLTIKDFGIGFDTLEQGNCSGIGLVSMRERARAIDGTLVVHSTRGVGTKVIAEVRYLPVRADLETTG
jgi:PAS domain S-box-containing protein